MNNIRLSGLVALVGALSNAGVTHAQSVDRLGLEEVIVTAQKREQSTQDVGMAITVVSGDDLNRRDITTAYDLTKFVPALSVANAASGSTVVYTLRGVGFNSANLGATSSVALYVDEIPVPYPAMSQSVALDLNRLEVYKGPQGTLFGQNSTGGAVNYIANKPTDVLEAGVEATYGRFGAWSVEGYTSGPISDTVRVRVALRNEAGGDWQKSYTRDETRGEKDRQAGRVLLDWTPTDNLDVTFGVNAWKDRSDAQALQLVKYEPLAPPGLAQVAAYPTAPKNGRAADWNGPGQFDKDYEHDSWFAQPFLRGDLTLTDDVTLTSITTYSRLSMDSFLDIDGTTYEIGEIRQQGDIKDFSQEIRASWDTDSMHWIFGGNYQTNSIDENFVQHIWHLSNTQNIGGSGYSAIVSPTATKQETDAWALFANVQYELSNQLELVGGARYTKTKIDFRGCNFDAGAPVVDAPVPGVTASLAGFFNILYQSLTGNATSPVQQGGCITLDNTTRDGTPADFLPTDSRQTLSEDNVSWNVTLNYKPTADNLLYARIAQGYKSGSFPTFGASTSVQYLPAKQESLLAYEAGFKSNAFGGTLNIEGAAFYYGYDDKQLSNFVPDSVFGPLPATVNVPESRVVGAELAIMWMPIQGLMINAQGSYIETKITEFEGYDVSGMQTDLRGESFNFAPEWSGSLDINYSIPISGSLTASFGGGITYRSGTSGVIGSTSEYYDIDGYSLIDVQAGIESSNGWMARLWGKNITDEYYWTNVNRISDTIVRAAGMPATYGVTVAKRF